MDEILQRMLAVEHEAGRIVQEAEAEAERIIEQGRAEANRLQDELQEQLNLAVAEIIEARVGDARREKQAALAAAAKQLQEREQELGRELSRNTSAVINHLAYSLHGLSNAT